MIRLNCSVGIGRIVLCPRSLKHPFFPLQRPPSEDYSQFRPIQYAQKDAGVDQESSPRAERPAKWALCFGPSGAGNGPSKPCRHSSLLVAMARTASAPLGLRIPGHWNRFGPIQCNAGMNPRAIQVSVARRRPSDSPTASPPTDQTSSAPPPFGTPSRTR